VYVLFGTKWLEAVPALVILPLIVPIRMICSVLFTTSLALGNRQLDLRNTIANFVLIPSGFFIGAHWGLVGLCSAWLFSIPLAYAFSVPAVLRFIGVRALDLMAECGAPAFAAGVMYAAVAAFLPAARRPACGRGALCAECRWCLGLFCRHGAHFQTPSGQCPQFRSLGAR
jgi:O-antigen/teichoic acid export membrane protein